MILYYFLVVTLPLLDQRWLSAPLAGFTAEKWLGLACFVYALFYAALRPGPASAWLQPLAAAPARAFLLFFLIALVSFCAFSRPEVGGREMMLVYASNLMFLVTTVLLVDSALKLRRALLAAITSLAVASLYMIRDWLAGSAIWGAGYRPGFVLGDSNYFTAGAILILPVAYYFFTQRGARWERLYCFSVCLLTLAAIMLGASRGGFLGLIAACLCMVFRARARARNLALIAVLIGLFAAISPTSPLRRLSHPSSGDQQAAQDRLVLWRAGAAMAFAHPLAGVGLGNFKSALPDYAPPGTDISFIAHNTYVEMAAEMGLPGLLAFLLIIGFAFRALARARDAAVGAEDGLVFAIAAGLQAGLVGFLVAVFFLSAAFLKLFWFVVFLSALLPWLITPPADVASEEDENALPPLAAAPPAQTPAPSRASGARPPVFI